MTRSFAADTALETLGEGVFGTVVPEHWFIVTGPNGGWIAAVLARSMETVTERPARSLTAHFLEAPAAGPVEIRATVERAGGSTSFVSLRMEQDGRTVALGLGVCAPWREGLPEWHDAEMPEVPAPDDAFRIDGERTPVPGFWSNYDGRGVAGVPRSGQPGPTIGWMRTAAPHPLDAPLVAALTDAWLPVAFSRWKEPLIVPTLDLTIHFRAPLPKDGWALLVMRTGQAAGGVWEEDGEVWSEDGTLLAQSRQLAIVRKPKHGGTTQPPDTRP